VALPEFGARTGTKLREKKFKGDTEKYYEKTVTAIKSPEAEETRFIWLFSYF